MPGASQTPPASGRCSPLGLGLAAAVIVIIASLSSRLVEARSVPCNCYHGTIASSEPRCECNCDSGYLPPDCSYGVADNVSVEVWYDFASGQYVRSRRVDALRANLNPGAPITFVYAKQGNYAKMSAVYKMLGRDAYNLKASVDTNLAWTTQEQIFAVYDLFTRVEQAPEARAHPTIVYQHGEIVLTAEGIGYIAAAAAAMVFLGLVEFCLCNGGNTVEEIQQDVLSGAWNVRLGYDQGMKYAYEAPPDSEKE